MPSRSKSKRPPGRQRIFKPDSGAGYLTIKFSGPQIRMINFIGGPAPGTRPAAIRALVDCGIAAYRAARARRLRRR